MFSKISKNKKVLVLVGVLVLILACAGFFYAYWQNQADVRELNADLPDGVKVEKSLFSNEYWVKNEIDGYEFKIPDEWKGINEIEYINQREVQGYIGSSLNLAGKEGNGNFLAIDYYISGGDMKNDLQIWAEENFQAFELIGDFKSEVILEMDIVKTQEDIHLGGEYVYFLKENEEIYVFVGPSEKTIQNIIINGKW